MPIIVDCALVSRPFPKQFSADSVYAKQLERVLAVGADAVRMFVGFSLVLVFDGFGAGNRRAFHVGGEKDFVTPNDR
jgi:hypothetical protein